MSPVQIPCRNRPLETPSLVLATTRPRLCIVTRNIAISGGGLIVQQPFFHAVMLDPVKSFSQCRAIVSQNIVPPVASSKSQRSCTPSVPFCLFFSRIRTDASMVCPSRSPVPVRSVPSRTRPASRTLLHLSPLVSQCPARWRHTRPAAMPSLRPCSLPSS